MMRYVTLALLMLVLITPFVLSKAIVAPAAQAPQAESSGQPLRRLVIVTPHNQDIRNEFARAFDAWHRQNHGAGITIDYRIPGGTNDIKRLLETTYRPYVSETDGTIAADVPIDIDMVWGGGDFFFDRELKRLEKGGKRYSILQPVSIGPDLIAQAFPSPTLGGIKLYDFTAPSKDGTAPQPQWIGVCISSFGMVYNPDFFKVAGLPEPLTWTDLTVPELAGRVALANPLSSGSAAVAYVMILQRHMADAEEAFLKDNLELAKLSGADRFKNPAAKAAISQGFNRGMSTLLLLAANSRYFTDSAVQVVNDVAMGDAVAGTSIDFYGRTYYDIVGSSRIRFVLPRAATAINPDPIAILYGVKGERLETANRFIEFLLTPQGQRLWITAPGSPDGPRDRALRRPPVRRDVYADRTNWTDDVNPFEESGGFNQRAEWMGTFTDLRMVWAAAWIDTRSALKSAYTAVLAHPTRRDELLAKLSALPITLEEVEQITAERGKQPSATVDAWRARKRLDLAQRFRSHYNSIEAEAGR